MISFYLNEFLKEGNKVVIVSSPEGHGTFSSVFEGPMKGIHATIEAPYQAQMKYYLQGRDNFQETTQVTKKMVDGKAHYYGENGLEGIHIDEKKKALEDVLKQEMGPYQIYALGDSYYDIPMLIKTQELGGQSALISQTLYRDELTPEQVIQNELTVEFGFPLRERMEALRQKYDAKFDFFQDPIYFSLIEKQEARKQTLYEQLSLGTLDLDECNRKYHCYLEYYTYEWLALSLPWDGFNGPFKKANQNNHLTSEKVNELLETIPCYPTFTEYYKKVLKRF